MAFFPNREGGLRVCEVDACNPIVSLEGIEDALLVELQGS